MRAVCALIAAALMLFCGCPDEKDKRPPPVKACEEVGQHCIHSPGKVGICGMMNDASACDSPPCLECVSNH